MVGDKSDFKSLVAMDPSSLLAAALQKIDALLQREPALLPELIEIAERARRDSEPVWEVDADTLYECLDIDLSAYADDMAPRQLARWIGGLDAWHRFANPAELDLSAAPMPPSAQEAEARLEQYGSYNDRSGLATGLLIPSVCADAPGAAYTDRSPLVMRYYAYRDNQRNPAPNDHLPETFGPEGANALLQNCTWLPDTLPCGHPDGTRHDLRTVHTGYIPAGQRSLPLPLDDRLPISVAPLAETSSCIEVVLTEQGHKYLVAPRYTVDRVKSAIALAFTQDCAILTFPEMTISSH